MKLYCDNCEITFDADNDNRFYERNHDGLFHCPECGEPLEEVFPEDEEDSSDEDEESDSDEE